MEVHETRERIEHVEEAAHHEKKRAALLIIILAVALAIIEMAGKEAQFASIAHNILSSDTYAFYQAKTIRSTFLRTAADSVEVLALGEGQRAEPVQKLIGTWRGNADRLDSDPSNGEGRKELLEKARILEEQRDEEEHSYHHFEYAAAGLQLAIVVASAAVITELATLELVSAGIGIIAVILGVLGWLAPALLRL